MRIAHLDCFAGISGDMFLGALLDAGVPRSVLDDAVAALSLGATLKIEKIDRSGITSTKVHVLENGHLAEEHAHSHSQAEAHGSAPSTPTHSAPQGEQTDEHHHQSETQHKHQTGQAHTHEHHTHTEEHSHTEPTHTHQPHEHTHEPHEHTHEPHEHSHGRSLLVIRDLIRNSSLAEAVKSFAMHTFELLGASEAKIHNVPVDAIHFHEVGAVDAIVDIVAASAGIHALTTQSIAETGEPIRWYCSPLNVGGGMVQCAHGNFPVPAPATADLLRGLPTYSAHIEKELVTPTGAALIRALAPEFSARPLMRVDHIGYGAGTRNPKGFPNVLRISLGETESAALPLLQSAGSSIPASTPTLHTHASAHHAHGYPVSFGEGTHGGAAHTDIVTILETALDDLSPQILAYVTEQALVLGAFDVMTSPVGMKKGRPGNLLTILTDEAHSPALERLLLRETSTLGIRVHQQRRICLARHHTPIMTPFGEIRMKIGSFDSEVINAAPEFEDCRAAAVAYNVPVKQVMQAAIAAYVDLSAKATTPKRSSEPAPA